MVYWPVRAARDFSEELSRILVTQLGRGATTTRTVRSLFSHETDVSIVVYRNVSHSECLDQLPSLADVLVRCEK